MTTTITTTTTTSKHINESTSASNNSSSSPVSHIGNAEITGIVSGVLIILPLTILAVLLFKRRRDRAIKRAEDMPVDLNPVYGIYDDGPVYNVVTDENDYYDS